MASSFDLAIPYIMANEGGWCNVKGDLGEETNFGWSMLTIRRLGLTLQDLGIDNWNPGCLKKMTKETAIKLYRIHFWDLLGINRISNQSLSTKYLDIAVNCGPGNANKIFQRACKVDDDGKMGPVTLAAINKAAPQPLMNLVCKCQAAYYEAIIVARPQNAQFRYNWLRRSSMTFGIVRS